MKNLALIKKREKASLTLGFLYHAFAVIELEGVFRVSYAKNTAID